MLKLLEIKKRKTANGLRKNSSLQLEERDLETLKSLEFWGVLGLAQLEGLVFRKQWTAQIKVPLLFNRGGKERYDTYAYKRLLKLEKAGLIRAISYVNLTKTYMLTRRGYRVLKRRGLTVFPTIRNEVPPSMVKHELYANAVGMTAAFVLGRDIVNERSLRLNNSRNKDGSRRRPPPLPDLLVKDAERFTVLEIELTPKSEKRYEKLWHRYFWMFPQQFNVCYLTGWPNGVRNLLRIARKYEHGFIYATSLEDFERNRGDVIFRSWHQNRVAVLTKPEKAPVEPGRAH